MSEEKDTIFYIYDALCGWCYGFSRIITAFYENHKDDYNFRVLSGGMIKGQGAGPIGKVAGFIKESYPKVEELTGIEFGQPFLENLEQGTALFSSVPPAMALALFRTQQPENELAFATRMQRAIYYEGKLPADWNTYGYCAADFGLNEQDFTAKMQNQKLMDLAQQEFDVVSHWGIKGFPTMVLQKGNQAYVLARGFTPLAELEEVFSQVLQKISEDEE